jgi:uncharacterized protein with NAD-binding domain and iron-sulfur cluster
MINDKVFQNGFNSIDDTNFWVWLSKHSTVEEGSKITRGSMWVRNAYDSSFAYEKGDSTSPPSDTKPLFGNPQMGAGTMLRGGVRLLLTYKGAMAWKFQAGCADIFCSPMYAVLKKRGVKYEFFNKVLNLSPSK